MHVCAEMPTKLVDDQLVLFELVVFVTMSRLQKIAQLSLEVRFVDIDGTVHEKILGFLSLERITGEAIANAILDVLAKWNLNIIAQGRDTTKRQICNRLAAVRKHIFSKNARWLSTLTIKPIV